MRGLIRIHLLTALFAMLFVSVLIGLNLQAVERASFCFYSAESGMMYAAAMTDDEVLVKYDRRAWYGWPYSMLSTEEFRESIYSRAEESELKNLPVHLGGCMVEALSAEQFKAKAPMLYRKFQYPQRSSGPYFSWELDTVLQYVCGALALLWSLMLALEWYLRSRALRDTTVELQSHA